MTTPPDPVTGAVSALAETLVLGALFDELRRRYGAFEVVGHFTQGEFHHDVVLDVGRAPDLPGRFVVVATNCNAGIKEVLVFDEAPTAKTLWALRCPEEPAFAGAPVLAPLARARTVHWFDPCELLTPDARSELKPEHRVRQEGGGWKLARD